MDYQKALDILELKQNFTEDDLKVSYRKLSKIYHPDKHKEGTDLYQQMVIKQQEINAARDCLKKYLNRHNVHNNNNKKTFDLNHYKQEKITELNKLLTKDKNITEQEFEEIRKKIIDIIYTFETDVWMSYVTTKQQVDNMYNLCITSIHNILINYGKLFFQKNYIDEQEIEEQINFGTNLQEYYNQLLKIKEKYSKEVKVSKLLDDEIEQYKGYTEYEKLEYLVTICKKNTFYYIKQNNFQNIEQEIQKMHQQIKQEIFDVYFTLKKKITYLESIINNIPDESIKKEYFAIYNSFEFGTSFYDTEKSIQKLEQRISEYQEMELKKQNQKLLEESINKIYQSLTIRYSETLKQYNVVKDYEIINTNNNLFNKLLELFRKGCEEYRDIEYFKLFNQIMFQNSITDNEVVQNILKSFNNNSNIYIKRRDKIRLFDENSFFYLDTEQMQIYQLGLTSVFNKRNITQKELDEDYISLEELLSISEYVGKYMTDLNDYEEKYIYYKTDGYIIYQESNNERIYILINPDIHVSCEDRHHKLFGEEMKDKKIMQEIIEKQVRERVEEYKKKQTPKSGVYPPDSRMYDEPGLNPDVGYNNGWNPHGRR